MCRWWGLSWTTMTSERATRYRLPPVVRCSFFYYIIIFVKLIFTARDHKSTSYNLIRVILQKSTQGSPHSKSLQTKRGGGVWWGGGGASGVRSMSGRETCNRGLLSRCTRSSPGEAGPSIIWRGFRVQRRGPSLVSLSSFFFRKEKKRERERESVCRKMVHSNSSSTIIYYD